MKKLMLALLLVIPAILQAQVLINEVQYDATQGGTDSLFEWVELYNPTGDDVDLTGWRICDNNDTLGNVCPSVVIGAGEYLVFACSLDSFHVNFPMVSATAWSSTSFGDGLSNTADMVVLVNSSGTAVDEVNWGTVNTSWVSWIKYGGFNPGAIDAAAGHSIGRSPNGFDTNVATDWADMAVPTPGASNGGAVVYTPHTIYEIQHDGGLTDSTVQVTGIVTSTKIVDSPGGIVIADASGAWHGVICTGTASVSRGDSVQVKGTVSETYELTKIVISSVTVLGTGTIPEAANVQLSDVRTGAANAESYEGVLVKLPKSLACDTLTFGEWRICNTTDTVIVDNTSTTYGIYYAKPVFGVDSVIVTGILNYTYSNFKVMPRDSADVLINPSGVSGQPPALTKATFSLMPCSPNPAKDDAIFSFSLAKNGQIELSVFNVLGQKVTTVYNGTLGAGLHSIKWNLKDQKNNQLPNGVYFYKLSDGSHSSTRRLLILK